MTVTLKRTLTITCLVTGLVAVAVSSADASIWIEPDRGNEVRLEALKPSFKGGEVSTFSLVWFLSCHGRVGKNVILRADVPYVHLATSEGDDSSNSVGNPYVGVDVGPRLEGFSGEFGLRLPLAQGNGTGGPALAYGLLAELVDRMDAFYPDILPVTLGGSYRFAWSNGFGLRLRLAPIFWIDLEDTLDDPAELWIRYSAQAHYRMGQAVLGTGITGRYVGSSGQDGDFGEKSMNELDVYVNLESGRMRPAFRIRIPLDNDLKMVQNTSFVISLGYALY